MDLMLSANFLCKLKSTGLWRIFVLAGRKPTLLPFFQSVFGLIGRGEKPPPQFGQTFSKTVSAHSRQKVHSKEQIIASAESGGSDLLQFSQVGLNSSMEYLEV